MTCLLDADQRPQVYGGDFDRAKKALASDATGIEISNITGIDAGLISHYRTGRRNLEQARWKTIARMTRAWDARFISEHMAGADAMKKLSKLDKRLDKLGDDEMAVAIRRVIMTDPLAAIYVMDQDDSDI